MHLLNPELLCALRIPGFGKLKTFTRWHQGVRAVGQKHDVALEAKNIDPS